MELAPFAIFQVFNAKMFLMGLLLDDNHFMTINPLKFCSGSGQVSTPMNIVFTGFCLDITLLNSYFLMQ
jgi:hypothetical protein